MGYLVQPVNNINPGDFWKKNALTSGGTYAQTNNPNIVIDVSTNRRVIDLDTTKDKYSLGWGAGNNKNTSGVSVGYFAGNNVTAVESIAIGKNALEGAAGLNNIAIGTTAGKSSAGQNVVNIGTNAGLSTLGNSNIHIGINAGGTAGNSNTNSYIGVNSGQSSVGNNNVGIGANSLRAISSAGSHVAIGTGSGEQSTANANSVFIGSSAGKQSNQEKCVFIGQNSGQFNTGLRSIGIGEFSLYNNTGDFVIGLGQNYYVPTSSYNQIDNCIVINNNYLIEFQNHNDALLYFTLANGCVRGNTYLYCEKNSQQIGYVRFT